MELPAGSAGDSDLHLLLLRRWSAHANGGCQHAACKEQVRALAVFQEPKLVVPTGGPSGEGDAYTGVGRLHEVNRCKAMTGRWNACAKRRGGPPVSEKCSWKTRDRANYGPEVVFRTCSSILVPVLCCKRFF